MGRQPSSELIDSGLPEFRWEELWEKEEIGRGSFGVVFTAKSRGEVVVKNWKILTDSSILAEKSYIEIILFPIKSFSTKLFRFLQKNKKVFVFVGGLHFHRGSSFS